MTVNGLFIDWLWSLGPLPVHSVFKKACMKLHSQQAVCWVCIACLVRCGVLSLSWLAADGREGHRDSGVGAAASENHRWKHHSSMAC